MTTVFLSRKAPIQPWCSARRRNGRPSPGCPSEATSLTGRLALEVFSLAGVFWVSARHVAVRLVLTLGLGALKPQELCL